MKRTLSPPAASAPAMAARLAGQINSSGHIGGPAKGGNRVMQDRDPVRPMPGQPRRDPSIYRGRTASIASREWRLERCRVGGVSGGLPGNLLPGKLNTET